MAAPLPSLTASFAPQPRGVAWPLPEWPVGPRDRRIDALVAQAFSDPALAETYAVLVVKEGRVFAERYGGALPSFTHPPTPVGPDTKLLSWSMAKSFLHAAVGVAVAEGRLDPDGPATVPEWDDDDERSAITVRHLLTMRDGLDWAEDYVDASRSDVIEMLFGAGKADVAAYAAARPLAAAPGARFNYSSGTSNLLSRALGIAVGAGAAMRTFLADRLFDPLGMPEATVTLDDAGTFIGSSYLYCTARSMARFATLYLRGGRFAGRDVLSEAWVGTAQVPTAADEDPDTYYSSHWWLDGRGRYWASGYEGQRAVIVPAADAIVVRYGRTPDADSGPLRAWSDEVVASLLER